MTRRALIICAENGDLPGAVQDARNLNSFLLSPRGGLWRSDEIVMLNSPSQSMVRAELALMSRASYSFVFFAGHGRYHVDKKTTEVQLQSGVYMDAADLRFGATKHTLILDTCRVLYRSTLSEVAIAKSMQDSAQFSEVNARQIFDRHLNMCPAGLFEINSCKVGETAGEESSGGYYTSSLLQVAKGWGSRANYGSVLTIKEAHDQAMAIVQRKTGNRQNPIAGYPRSTPYFPFAVKG